MSKYSIEMHADRGRIEYDIRRGIPVRVIAQKYGISKDAAYCRVGGGVADTDAIKLLKIST